MKTAVLKGQSINLKVRKFKNPALRWEIEKSGSFSVLDYFWLIYDNPDTGKREVLGQDYATANFTARNDVAQIERKNKTRIKEIEKLHTDKVRAAALAANASGWWATRRDEWGDRGAGIMVLVRLWLLLCVPVHLVLGVIAWAVGADGFDPAILWLAVILDVLAYVGVTALQWWLVVDPEKGIDWSKVRL